MKSTPLVISSVAKAYAGIPVLVDVSVTVKPGTFLAVAGENGAGKSTLLKIASGVVSADSGTVRRGDGQVRGTPSSARTLGVALVPQELEPLPDMTIYENIFLAHELSTLGFLRRGEMIRRSADIMQKFGLDLDPRSKVSELSIGNIQLLEIIKAVSSGAEFILLDEPTSSLSEQEVKLLFEVLRRLRSDGLSALFTTHKMHEIRALADRVVVLRDGRLILDEATDSVEDHEIVTSMIGRELGDLFPELPTPTDHVAIEISGVEAKLGHAPINLTVRQGEIVGLAGLVGAGRTEFLEAVFGVTARRSGEVRVDGALLKPGSIRSSIANGLALVPEERKSSGLVLEMSALDNATLASIPTQSRLGFLYQVSRRSTIGDVFDQLNLRYRNVNQSVSTLSGGNQQKVVIGRWLIGSSRVLLLDEPTRGVDVGARSEIYRIIADLAASGAAVLMASSDMTEVIGLSHRIVVFGDGAVAGELNREEIAAPDAQERIFALASTAADDASAAA